MSWKSMVVAWVMCGTLAAVFGVGALLFFRWQGTANTMSYVAFSGHAAGKLPPAPDSFVGLGRPQTPETRPRSQERSPLLLSISDASESDAEAQTRIM